MDQVEVIQRGIQGRDLEPKIVNLGFNSTILSALIEILKDDSSLIDCKLENSRTGVILGLTDLGMENDALTVKDYYGDWWTLRLGVGTPWARIRFFPGPNLISRSSSSPSDRVRVYKYGDFPGDHSIINVERGSTILSALRVILKNDKWVASAKLVNQGAVGTLIFPDFNVGLEGYRGVDWELWIGNEAWGKIIFL
jgi:hypothetical protein